MNEPLDRWIRRATVAAMVAVACALLGTGVALYVPGAPAAQGAVRSK